MTIFELVKIALDELYAEGKSEYGDKLDEVIIERIKYLSKSYTDLCDTNRNPVDYKDPATRFAYVYKYVAAHGDYIVQVMNKFSDKFGPIFSSETARISCIGGGPGSDIIATLKYLSEHGEEPVKKVICYLLDREQAWADTWTELDESLDTKVKLNANFQPLDVTDTESWQSQKKFLQADLFTMSYFVSEVMSLDKDHTVTEFWLQLFQHAKPGALFLYIDNGHDDFNKYIDKISAAAGLEILQGSDNASYTPSFKEQKSELDVYSKKFSHNPKLKSTLSVRIMRKP